MKSYKINYKNKISSVGFVTPYYFPYIGGAENQIKQLSKIYKKNGVDVCIITDFHKGLKKKEIIEGVEVYRILKYFYFPQKYKIKNLLKIEKKSESSIETKNCNSDNKRRKKGLIHNLIKSIRMLNELIKYLYVFVPLSIFFHKKKVEIIHCFLLNPKTIIVAAISKLYGKKVIIRQSGEAETQNLNNFLCNRFYKFILRNLTDFSIAISESCRKELISIGIEKKRIYNIPNGINIDTFKPLDIKQKKRILKKYNLGNKRYITFVGSVKYIKGIDILIKCVKSISKEYEDINLLVVGRRTKFTKKIDDMIHNYSLNEYVHFIGEIKDVNELYNLSNLYVSPSRSEGLSNALLEAMSTGLPVIATSTSGSVDVIKNRENGLLVKINDPKSLNNAIKEILNNEEFASTIGKNAREAICKNYSINKIVKEYFKLYSILTIK